MEKSEVLEDLKKVKNFLITEMKTAPKTDLIKKVTKRLKGESQDTNAPTKKKKPKFNGWKAGTIDSTEYINAGTHYGYSINSEKLAEWEETILPTYEKAIKDMPKGIIPVLCYRGMSGVRAAATVARVLYNAKIEFHELYVRKPEEKSHGNKIEHTFISVKDKSKFVLVFCDDFMSYGDTRLEVLTAAKNFIMSRDRFAGSLLSHKAIQLFTSHVDDMVDPDHKPKVINIKELLKDK